MIGEAPHYVVRPQRERWWALVRVFPDGHETAIDRTLTKGEAIRAARLLTGWRGTYLVEPRTSRKAS